MAEPASYQLLNPFCGLKRTWHPLGVQWERALAGQALPSVCVRLCPGLCLLVRYVNVSVTRKLFSPGNFYLENNHFFRSHQRKKTPENGYHDLVSPWLCSSYCRANRVIGPHTCIPRGSIRNWSALAGSSNARFTSEFVLMPRALGRGGGLSVFNFWLTQESCVLVFASHGCHGKSRAWGTEGD